MTYETLMAQSNPVDTIAWRMADGTLALTSDVHFADVWVKQMAEQDAFQPNPGTDGRLRKVNAKQSQPKLF